MFIEVNQQMEKLIHWGAHRWLNIDWKEVIFSIQTNLVTFPCHITGIYNKRLNTSKTNRLWCTQRAMER